MVANERTSSEQLQPALVEKSGRSGDGSMEGPQRATSRFEKIFERMLMMRRRKSDYIVPTNDADVRVVRSIFVILMGMNNADIQRTPQRLSKDIAGACAALPLLPSPTPVSTYKSITAAQAATI